MIKQNELESRGAPPTPAWSAQKPRGAFARTPRTRKAKPPNPLGPCPPVLTGAHARAATFASEAANRSRLAMPRDATTRHACNARPERREVHARAARRPSVSSRRSVSTASRHAWNAPATEERRRLTSGFSAKPLRSLPLMAMTSIASTAGGGDAGSEVCAKCTLLRALHTLGFIADADLRCVFAAPISARLVCLTGLCDPG